MYDQHGVKNYYENHANEYFNPHAEDVKILLNRLDCYGIFSGIDFSCGDGLVSSHLHKLAWTGVDPYLNTRYTDITGNRCVRATMEEVSKSMVLLPIVDVVVCSYCIDIFEKSYMKNFLWHLSEISDKLVVIRSNKKVIDSICWELQDYEVSGRSHMTVYTANKDLRP